MPSCRSRIEVNSLQNSCPSCGHQAAIQSGPRAVSSYLPSSAQHKATRCGAESQRGGASGEVAQTRAQVSQTCCTVWLMPSESTKLTGLYALPTQETAKRWGGHLAKETRQHRVNVSVHQGGIRTLLRSFGGRRRCAAALPWLSCRPEWSATEAGHICACVNAARAGANANLTRLIRRTPVGATKEPSTHRLLGLPLEHGSSQLRIVVPDLYPRTRAARPQKSGERMAAGPVGGQS